jgi:hypothetical protein
MLRRIGRGLLWGSAGYLGGAIATYFLTMSLSSNVHDRALEASMTGAFVVGPAAALAGFLIGFFRRR